MFEAVALQQMQKIPMVQIFYLCLYGSDLQILLAKKTTGKSMKIMMFKLWKNIWEVTLRHCEVWDPNCSLFGLHVAGAEAVALCLLFCCPKWRKQHWKTHNNTTCCHNGLRPWSKYVAKFSPVESLHNLGLKDHEKSDSWYWHLHDFPECILVPNNMRRVQISKCMIVDTGTVLSICRHTACSWTRIPWGENPLESNTPGLDACHHDNPKKTGANHDLIMFSWLTLRISPFACLGFIIIHNLHSTGWLDLQQFADGTCGAWDAFTGALTYLTFAPILVATQTSSFWVMFGAMFVDFCLAKSKHVWVWNPFWCSLHTWESQVFFKQKKMKKNMSKNPTCGVADGSPAACAGQCLWFCATGCEGTTSRSMELAFWESSFCSKWTKLSTTNCWAGT